MDVDELQRQNAILNEQVKLLVRTEKKLYGTQQLVEVQLRRIRALNDFALTSLHASSVSEVLHDASQLLSSLFPVRALLAVLWPGGRRAPIAIVRGADGLASEQEPPADVQAMFAVEQPNTSLLFIDHSSELARLPILGWLDTLSVASEPTRPTVGSYRGISVVLSIGSAKVDGPSATIAFRSSTVSSHDTLPAESDRPFLDLICRHVAGAMEMTALHAVLTDRTHALESSLKTLHETQDQLLHAGKMAAIGQLAAGVAHEINNPLAVILGFAQGLDRRVAIGDPLHLAVSSIVRESLRCKALVQDLLTFSRTAKKSREDVDPNKILVRAGHLLESRARTQNTKIIFEHGDVPNIKANSTQLEQIVVNLGNNALDALHEGGEIVLRTRPTDSGAIIIEVRDNGPGIPKEARARLFEPFFTTKEVGKGTGLGLSLVYEITQQHGGSIEVQTELGEGTAMIVRLPIAPPPDPSEGNAA